MLHKKIFRKTSFKKNSKTNQHKSCNTATSLKTFRKNNILISEKEGRNKNYKLNLNNEITKNSLIITELLRTNNYLKKNKIIKTLLFTNKSLILFGSYANNTQKTNSDIDLFLIGKLTEKEKQELKKISQTLNMEINIKSQNKFEINPLTKEIIQNHIVLSNAEEFVNNLWNHYNEIENKMVSETKEWNNFNKS